MGLMDREIACLLRTIRPFTTAAPPMRYRRYKQ
jgi:hypothetical protein